MTHKFIIIGLTCILKTNLGCMTQFHFMVEAILLLFSLKNHAKTIIMIIPLTFGYFLIELMVKFPYYLLLIHQRYPIIIPETLNEVSLAYFLFYIHM